MVIVISLVSMVEGFRITIYKDPKILYDILGPGIYILIISFLLMTTGIAHLFINYRKVPIVEKVAEKKDMRIRLIGMILVYAAYIFLIDLIGYLIPSVIFFLLEFRIAGVKSWMINVILALSVTLIFYIIFVQCCNVIFPGGIFLH